MSITTMNQNNSEDYFQEDPALDLENDADFLKSFAASFTMILLSELGDKSFFIAAIMAMRYSRRIVFLGAMSALTVMTLLSAFCGYAARLFPPNYICYISIALFAGFGLKMLYEGYKMDVEKEKEIEVAEIQSEITSNLGLPEETASLRAVTIEQSTNNDTIVNSNSSTWTIKPVSISRSLSTSGLESCSKVFVQSFTMTFLAECGDRSQLALIMLGATEDIAGLCVGGLLGHCVCTCIAVIGGNIIAQRISIRTVMMVGGAVFILYSIIAFISILT